MSDPAKARVIPSSVRATVISSVSLVANIGGIGGQLGLGYLSRAQLLAAGYVTGGWLWWWPSRRCSCCGA
jgi:hypothetical protein